MLVIRVSKAALALTHDIDGTFLMFCHIPRWSSGQDFALSPRRPGFDSPSGKTFLLAFFSNKVIGFGMQAIRGVPTTVCCDAKPFKTV